MYWQWSIPQANRLTMPPKCNIALAHTSQICLWLNYCQVKGWHPFCSWSTCKDGSLWLNKCHAFFSAIIANLLMHASAMLHLGHVVLHMWPNFTKPSQFSKFILLDFCFLQGKMNQLTKLLSWAMPKIQPWIAGQANKQFCTQTIEKKSRGAWKNNHNLLMQRCTKLKLDSFYLPGISPPTKIQLMVHIYFRAW